MDPAMAKFLLDCIQFARDKEMPTFDPALAMDAAISICPFQGGVIHYDSQEARTQGHYRQA